MPRGWPDVGTTQRFLWLFRGLIPTSTGRSMCLNLGSNYPDYMNLCWLYDDMKKVFRKCTLIYANILKLEITAVPLTVRDTNRGHLSTTITRMAGFCSSTTAPALFYYRPSVVICKTCTSTVRGGRLRVLSHHGWFHGVSLVVAPDSCLGLK